MSKIVDTFANRLSYAIKKSNMKPIDISKKTGISKTNLSNYTAGRYEAKQDGVQILSEILNVNPLWLMGYDVPMEKQSDKLENKLLKLDRYIEENDLDEIVFIPVFDNIDLKDDWQTSPTGYTPFDFKIQSCSKDKNYFYYKISDNSMNIEEDTYVLIEDTQDVNINDIILYSVNNHIELGIYKLNLEQEKNFEILGKYIK